MFKLKFSFSALFRANTPHTIDVVIPTPKCRECCHDVIHIIAVITTLSCALNRPELLRPETKAHKHKPPEKRYIVLIFVVSFLLSFASQKFPGVPPAQAGLEREEQELRISGSLCVCVLSMCVSVYVFVGGNLLVTVRCSAMV